MSEWTRIAKIIRIEHSWDYQSQTGFRTEKSFKKYLDKVLAKAPKITGLEEDAEVGIVFMQRSGITWVQDKPRGEIKEIETWGRATLVIDASLRNRTPERTKAEWKAFLKYLKSLDRVSVKVITVNSIRGC